VKEDQLVEIWTLFRHYIDKKNLEIAAEKYVDLLADYGVDEITLKDALGNDDYLDDAISYFLDIDVDNDDEDD
jgi:hypothetical protein